MQQGKRLSELFRAGNIDQREYEVKVSEQQLRACNERARLDQVPMPSAAEWSLAFERSYQMSVGAVINRNLDRHGSDARVGLFNPSVGDFVLRRFGDDAASLESFFSFLRDYRSLAHFQALRKSGIVNDSVFIAVFRKLAKRFWREPLLTPEFSSDLASFITNNEGLRSTLRPELVALSAQFFLIADASTRPEALSDWWLRTGKKVCRRLSDNDRDKQGRCAVAIDGRCRQCERNLFRNSLVSVDFIYPNNCVVSDYLSGQRV